MFIAMGKSPVITVGAFFYIAMGKSPVVTVRAFFYIAMGKSPVHTVGAFFYTQSSCDIRSGLTYSNPSNSVWSILPITLL